MGRKRTRLVLTDAQREELRRRLRTARDAREKERLRVVLCAAHGKHTLEDLARMSGRVRATIQTWLKKFHEGGMVGLLDRDTPPGSVSPVATEQVQTQLCEGMAIGRWRSASEVATWLKETHGIKRATKSVYYWLAKNRPQEPRPEG